MPIDPVSIGIGAAVGIVVGVGVMFPQKSKADKLRAEQDQLKSSTGKQISELQQKQSSTEKELAEVKKKADAAEAKSATTSKELEQVKTKLGQAEGGRKKAEESIKSESAARGEAEKARDANKQRAEQAQAKLGELEGQLRTAQATAEQSKQQAAKLQKALASAQANTGGGAAASPDVLAALEAAGVDMEKILGVLIQKEGQKAAVLADSNGIVVSAAGDSGLQEGVAATAQMLSRLNTQFEGMVPFAAVRAFSLGDTGNTVIAGRTFVISGEMIALATFGAQHPSAGALDTAADRLKAALG